jgi:hypothetical protein
VLAATVASGCTKTIVVRRYPAFWTPELKTVAVLPLANDSLDVRAGEFMTDRLTEALRANGTYEVVGAGELVRRVESAGLAIRPGDDETAIAATLRKLGGIQAFVVGRVKVLSADRWAATDVVSPHVWYGGGYGWGRGGWRQGVGWSAPIYAHSAHGQAFAAMTAAVVRVSDGRRLYTTAGPVTARVSTEGYPPPTPGELLDQAARAAAERLVAEVAIVERELKIKAGKVLRTGRRRWDGTVKYTDDFDREDEQMLVVIRLPAEADRNRFRLTVSREGAEEPIAEEQFAWSRTQEAKEFSFSPSDLAKAGGTGEYKIRLYAGRRLLLTEDFDID